MIKFQNTNFKIQINYNDQKSNFDHIYDLEDRTFPDESELKV